MARTSLFAFALFALLNTSKAQDWGLDPTFADGGVYLDTLGGVAAFAHDVTVQDDGKIVVCGHVSFNTPPWYWDWFVLRLNSDGSLDPTFANDGKLIYSWPSSNDQALVVRIDSQNRIVIGGFHFDGIEQWPLVTRLTPNGILDATFGNNGIVVFDHPDVDEQFDDLAVQPDGKILLAMETLPGFAVARLDQEGGIDNAFGTNGLTEILDDDGISSNAQLEIMADGRIVMNGFSGLNAPDVQNKLARFMPDGSLDGSYGTGGISVITTLHAPFQPLLNAMALAPDGSIYLAGRALRPDPYAENQMIAHVTSDGLLDTSFGDSSGYSIHAGSYIMSVARDLIYAPEGKIILAGFFLLDDLSDYDAMVSQYDLDGQLDTAFGSGGILQLPFSGSVFPSCMSRQDDGGIILTGYANQLGSASAYCSRVILGITDQVTDLITGPTSSGLHIWPNPGRDHILVRCPAVQGDLFLFNAIGQQFGTWQTTPAMKGMIALDLPPALCPGSYLLRWCSGPDRTVGRLMIE